MAQEPRWVVYLDSAREYRWRFRASNNKIIADSAEGYVRKSDCLSAIALMKRDGPDGDVVDITS